MVRADHRVVDVSEVEKLQKELWVRIPGRRKI